VGGYEDKYMHIYLKSVDILIGVDPSLDAENPAKMLPNAKALFPFQNGTPRTRMVAA
jgi:hypothetical protein